MKAKRGILWAALVVVVALVGARVAAPYLIEDWVNGLLSGREDYSGSVGDVDLALWRGAYRIERIQIEKIGGDPDAPFFRAAALDLSLQWDALFSGSLVGRVRFERPELRLGQDEETGREQLGAKGEWVSGLQKLMPLRIDRLQANNGFLSYGAVKGADSPELTIRDVKLVATNLTNIEGARSDGEDEEAPFPSRIVVDGVAQDDAAFSARGSFDLLAQPFDLDLDLECEPMSLSAFNPILRERAALDVKSGTMGLFAEWLVEDGQLDGYLKFVVRDLEILDISSDSENPLSLAWQAIADFFVNVTENDRTGQFATKVPLSGKLDEVDRNLVSAVVSIFENGFVQAMTRDVDETIGESAGRGDGEGG